MKKLIIFFVSLFAFNFNIQASSDITIYIFHGEGCGHCANALNFLNTYVKECDNVNLVKYEVWEDFSNKQLMNDVASILNTNVTGVPFIVIGETYIRGFGSGDNEKIKYIVDNYKKSDYKDVVKMYLDKEISLDDNDEINGREETTDNLNVYSNKKYSDVKKCGITFIIIAMIVVIILIILEFIKNKKRAYVE